MTQPWLSVVMPVFNGANYLDHALQSILSQRDDGVEVIAVEGGSTDNTVDILNSYRGRLHLKLFTSELCESWVAKTNHGLANARGDYVCFLHHDDLWSEDRLRVLRLLVEQAPDATMFLHPSWFIDPEGMRVGVWRCPLSHGLELEPEFVVERLLIQNFISIPALDCSRELPSVARGRPGPGVMVYGGLGFLAEDGCYRQDGLSSPGTLVVSDPSPFPDHAGQSPSR